MVIRAFFLAQKTTDSNDAQHEEHDGGSDGQTDGSPQVLILEQVLVGVVAELNG